MYTIFAAGFLGPGRTPAVPIDPWNPESPLGRRVHVAPVVHIRGGFGEEGVEEEEEEDRGPVPVAFELIRPEQMENAREGILPQILQGSQLLSFQEVVTLMRTAHHVKEGDSTNHLPTCVSDTLAKASTMTKKGVPLGCRPLRELEAAKEALGTWVWVHPSCGIADCKWWQADREHAEAAGSAHPGTQLTLTPFEVMSVIDKAALVKTPVLFLDPEVPRVRLTLYDLVPGLCRVPPMHQEEVEAGLLTAAFGSEEWRTTVKRELWWRPPPPPSP